RRCRGIRASASTWVCGARKRSFHVSSGTCRSAPSGTSSGSEMKVLVFTTLFPSNMWPDQGVFVKERVVRLARQGCTTKVVAPVPYCPSLGLGWRSRFARIVRQENRDGLEVHHPRYLMTPKVGMTLYGLSMFLSVLSTV